MRKANALVLAGKVPFHARERCYPAGVPGWVIYTLAEPILILQTDKQVTMINRGGPEVRRIYLDVPHSANPKPSRYGESVGHCEVGDTLVVDTIAISTKTPWSATQRFRRVPHEWTEDICAENNFDFLQYEVAPLPQAAKPDF